MSVLDRRKSGDDACCGGEDSSKSHNSAAESCANCSLDEAPAMEGYEESVIPDNQIMHRPSPNSVENYPETGSSEKKSFLGDSSSTSCWQPCTYLGSTIVNAPRSEVEIYQKMTIFNQLSQTCSVALLVPKTSEGTVRLVDLSNNLDIASFQICNIMFFVKGPNHTPERICFAFTCSHGSCYESCVFEGHFFRCDVPDAICKLFHSFSNIFQMVPKLYRKCEDDSTQKTVLDIVFSVSLDFQEMDGKGNFTPCAKEKDVFKFKVNTEKRLQIMLHQSGSREVKIDRCFGLLLYPGRNAVKADVHLVELISMTYMPEAKQYKIEGHWDPFGKGSGTLNTETEKDTRVILSVVIDLVLCGIQKPVRLTVETKANIFDTSERLWSLRRKEYIEKFCISLEQVKDGSDPVYEVIQVENQTEQEKLSWPNFSHVLCGVNSVLPEQAIVIPEEKVEDSEDDEPLLSGSGIISQEVTDQFLLDAWADVLHKWHSNVASRPRQVKQLCRKAVPDGLRGEVWQLLAGSTDSEDLLEAYRVLLGTDSLADDVIKCDIKRTFLAHDFFKESGGQGQEYLYNISKAYSVYDKETGYVQGFSFLAAPLLLHMPEEQAFCIMVKIMYNYQLRQLYREGFQELYLKLYQLERLLQDQLPDLHYHFTQLLIKVHMFASQWFLTLFTAKFPLQLVYYILDLFLSEGNIIIFKVALALLRSSKQDLLMLDFDGVLKFFRVLLPKRYRTEKAAKELICCAIGVKVVNRKLKKYEKEYQTMQEQKLKESQD